MNKPLKPNFRDTLGVIVTTDFYDHLMPYTVKVLDKDTETVIAEYGCIDLIDLIKHLVAELPHKI